MSDVVYFCPRCQGTELYAEPARIVASEGGTRPRAALCKLCQWEGSTEDLVGALAPDNAQFWTGERVANALLMAGTKYAAGPIAQCLEVLGLKPKVEDLEGEQRKAAEHIHEEVMREVLAAIVTAAFEKCAELVPAYRQRYEADSGSEVSERVFSFAEPSS